MKQVSSKLFWEKKKKKNCFGFIKHPMIFKEPRLPDSQPWRGVGGAEESGPQAGPSASPLESVLDSTTLPPHGVGSWHRSFLA